MTVQLDDVPLEMAVRVMTEMAGLRPVKMGNILFVTSRANAVELRGDPDLNPQPMQGGGPDSPVPPGGRVAVQVAPGAAPAPPPITPAVPVPPAEPGTPPDHKPPPEGEKESK